jgi:glycogen(starch) synthase
MSEFDSSNARKPSISIVINTLNRGKSLDATLESFKWLRYEGLFEVIVVNGPSTDNSDEVIARWSPYVRAEKCPVANLSVSRNIGICLARGDVIAFIDDDAIPEPEWLEQLSTAYEDPQVGAVGGLVFDHTGYSFQYKYCLIDRFGNADLSPPAATPHLCYPKSYRFPHLLGANSSFRTSALLEVGGFDEEYEYFLDETDVCLRIVDAGYLIAQQPNAYVHHKFAPSNLRGHNRVARNRFPIIKNKIYFTLKHAREFHTLDRVLQEQLAFVESQRSEMNWAFSNEMVSAEDMSAFERDVDRAVEIGLRRGFEGVKPGSMIDERKRRDWPGEFREFMPLGDGDRCTLVLISKDFPPDHGGGVATFNKDLAEAYAARGNIVHVVTQSRDINRVDFENGVWVHRLAYREIERSARASTMGVPQHIWNWSAIAHDEVQRISTHRIVDVVEAPIWDCEGIAFMLDRRWPLVTSLQTTLHFWLESHGNYRDDETWMASFGAPMLALERELMQHSDAVRSISAAVRSDIERAYDFQFDSEMVQIIPLGMAQATAVPVRRTESPVVLFVGRLEGRKGIDILLDAIPLVLAKEPAVMFRIIGDNTLCSPKGSTYAEEFLACENGRRWADHVLFEGRVDDLTLRTAYASCDVFVAPSRFESFGLVFLEAMREGKPVIGCDVGGMPEVVSANESGLLVKPADVGELADAILALLRSESLRRAFGEAGRRIFESRFTSSQMAARSVDLYRFAKRRFLAYSQ